MEEVQMFPAELLHLTRDYPAAWQMHPFSSQCYMLPSTFTPCITLCYTIYPVYIGIVKFTIAMVFPALQPLIPPQDVIVVTILVRWTLYHIFLLWLAISVPRNPLLLVNVCLFLIGCDSSPLFHASLVLHVMPVQDPFFFLSFAKVQESLRSLVWRTTAFCYLCLKKWLWLSLLLLGRFSQIIQHRATIATLCHYLSLSVYLPIG